ncbi:C4-dicarboxylate ABC transporter [Rhodococcus sp. WMMA185]|uniref:TDT family transporter n=1 Tax=Rhodococcus sp. WMMA185 TaxID=679318 RepID=UPI00087837FA|nr:TDT family transporter [Rhodococcus sp. WMMA185]AOW92140.1 C4-dicarboxylate ABC transporter [Rhodococcus sp. WMMA185]
MTPNWFATVMGTGIIAVVAAALPAEIFMARIASELFWLIAVALLIGLTAALARHWARRREDALGDVRSHAMFPFYGAVSMAVLTVGAGAGSAGRALLGSAAVGTSAVLWTIGTVIGLATYFVMVRRLTRPHQVAPTPSWLLPVVPPMVSAAGGAALVRQLPQGAPKVAMLVICYALFALALIAALSVAVVVGGHLLSNGLPATPLIPTVWIPLGVIGQSVAATNLLGAASGLDWLHTFGAVYGIAIGAFGVIALMTVVAVTARAFLRGLSFTPTWWSFTFPVGTCALGANSLGVALGSAMIVEVGVILWCALLLIWGTVTFHTLRHGARLMADRFSWEVFRSTHTGRIADSA